MKPKHIHRSDRELKTSNSKIDREALSETCRTRILQNRQVTSEIEIQISESLT
jgi:hypothetical protein